MRAGVLNSFFLTTKMVNIKMLNITHKSSENLFLCDIKKGHKFEGEKNSKFFVFTQIF